MKVKDFVAKFGIGAKLRQEIAGLEEMDLPAEVNSVEVFARWLKDAKTKL